MSQSIYTAFATATATISSTAKSLQDCGFTADQVAAARNAVICVRTANIVATWVSGVTPTASAGISLPAGGTYVVEGTDNIGAWKSIREGATDSSITVILER